MLPISAFQKIFMLLPFAIPTPTPAPSSNDVEWSYDDVQQWGVDSPTCDGYRQSPIELRSTESLYIPIPPIRFINYDVPLKGPLKLQNNGHTVNMDIPATRNGAKPMITGGKLTDRYEAVGVHFHWGSPTSKGSEHIIDNTRYDVEMHIVHKNVNYGSVEEATQYSNGLAVIAIMFTMVTNPDRYYPGLNKIFNKLPLLVEYESMTKIKGSLTLGQLIGDVNTQQFFTYKGSLTTPPCSEAVTWQVYPDPLPIAASQIYKFFDLIDSHGEPLEQNYRPVQPLDGRKVIFRGKPSFIDYPLFGGFK